MTGVIKPIKCLAAQRQIILVRQLDLHSEFVADINILFPTRKTSADADLLQQRFLFFTEFCVNDRRDVERKSDVLSLIY